jgi:hypothetical protein
MQPSCGGGMGDFHSSNRMKDSSDIITGNAQGRASTEMQIAVRAYELWQMAGAPHGRDLDFWFVAEGELRAEHETKPAWEETARKQATPEKLGE